MSSSDRPPSDVTAIPEPGVGLPDMGGVLVFCDESSTGVKQGGWCRCLLSYMNGTKLIPSG